MMEKAEGENKESTKKDISDFNLQLFKRFPRIGQLAKQDGNCFCFIQYWLFLIWKDILYLFNVPGGSEPLIDYRLLLWALF